MNQKILQHNHHNHFTAILPGSPGWSGARREILDFIFFSEKED